jgi:hypothetical protein
MTDGRQEEAIRFENAPHRQDTVSVSHGVERSPLMIGDSFAQSRIALELYVHHFVRGAAVDVAIKVTKSLHGISDLMGFGATSESLQSTVRTCESFLNGILVTRVINTKIPMEFNETKLLLDGSGRMICCNCHISEASTWTWKWFDPQ